jgi:hypothetical protein
LTHCAYCGAETILFEAGVPICLACSQLKEQGKLRMLPNIEDYGQQPDRPQKKTA